MKFKRVSKIWDRMSTTKIFMYSHSKSKVTCPGGGTQYKSGYRDVPQTWVAKSGRQVHQWVPFFQKHDFDGSIFQNFLKFAPKWRKFGTLIGQLFKILAKNYDFWYIDGSLFLQNGYMDGWHFKNPSGTPLPRPKLSTPPPGSLVKRGLWMPVHQDWTKEKPSKISNITFATLSSY